MLLAETIVVIALVYASIGVAFAICFVLFGAGKIDPGARGVGIGFRLLILPGAAALWPLLLIRWIGRRQPPVENTPHRRAAREVAR